MGGGHQALEAALPEVALTPAPAQPPQLGGDPPPHPSQRRLHDVHQLARVALCPVCVLLAGLGSQDPGKMVIICPAVYLYLLLLFAIFG